MKFNILEFAYLKNNKFLKWNKKTISLVSNELFYT